MNKTKKFFIIHILLSILILIIAITSLVLLFKDVSLIASILLVITLILVFINIKVKNQFDYLRHETVLKNLINNQNKPYKLKNKLFDNNFYNHIEKTLSYQKYKQTNTFDLYYKIDYDDSKKSKNKVLYSILILKNNLPFIDNNVMKAFEDLENSFTRKDGHYNKRLFYVFKQNDGPFTKDNIIDANKVFFLSVKRVNIVILNVLYNTSNEIYYLNAPNVKTPHIFNLSYKHLNEIIKF